MPRGESKKLASGEILRTFTIITTSPNEFVAKLHNRMPVIIPPDLFGRWLGLKPEAALEMLRSYPDDLVQRRPANERVGNWRFAPRL